MNQDRKNELEQKKAKLEQIRLQKLKQQQQQQQQQKSGTSPTATSKGAYSADTPVVDTSSVDPDKILIECGITTPILTSSNTNSTTSLSSITNQADDQNIQQHQSLMSSKLLSVPKTKKPIKLSVNQVNSIEIAPRELVTYSKETQTPAVDTPTDNSAAKPLDYYVLTYDNIDDDDATSVEVSASSNLKEKSKQTESDKKNQKVEEEKAKPQIKEANDEERQKLVQNDDFLSFFTKNARILERALDQDDIFFDYGEVDKNKEIIETGQVIKFNREFYDDRWKNRVVTWLDWSLQYPELLLASYEDSNIDPDGVAVVWNTKFKSTCPEYTFNCSSWVTSCCFAKFHPNLVIGGTYSGQIVMWDNRSNKRTPIQRSSLSASSHTHPVYCIQVVGSQNAHNLITISNDGKLCSWTLDNMNTPQETLDLQCKQSKNVAVTTMCFRPGDVNNFIVGSEEGPLYTATRHGNKSGINESFEGHFGPITGLTCNQVQGPIDFSHLFLTSSFDWTVKLWNVKEPGRSLYSFENNSDYVYDVAWSPVHPALFATIDGTGRLDLWNLINDSEVPSATIHVDNGSAALNKLRWTQNGLQLVVGDDQGKICMFDINENYAIPRADDWTKFVRVLQDLKQNTSELDEPVAAGSANTTPNTGGTPGAAGIQQTPVTGLSSNKSEANLLGALNASTNPITPSASTPSMQILSQLKAAATSPLSTPK